MILAPLEPARGGDRISTRILTPSLTRVQTADRVVGWIRTDPDGFAALRGADVKTASTVGRYATPGLALEAVRLRRRSI